MLKFMQRLVNRKDEQGASAVEYGLLVAAIAAIIVVIVFALGGIIQSVFSETCSAVGDGVNENGGAVETADCEA